MATLKDRLRSDLTDSMRARDELRTGTLRMALTAVTNAEVAGTHARELSDDEVLAVLGKELKKRREAATAFADAGRTDSAERERAEAAVLAEYLPTALTSDELAALIAEAIEEVGAGGPQDMGQVMRLVQPRVAGRAEGKSVADEVRRQLTG
jgi:uncharacterized protein YqeY